MDLRETSLFLFRKLVYLLYLEIGALQPRIHPEVAEKANLNTAYFQREKGRQAASLYYRVENEMEPQKVVAPFEERTGLALEDIERAFREGDWRNRHGAFNFGGPRWARVAEVTLKLQRAIEQGNEQDMEALIFEIKGLKTNQGYLVNQLDRTERRR